MPAYAVYQYIFVHGQIIGMSIFPQRHSSVYVYIARIWNVATSGGGIIRSAGHRGLCPQTALAPLVLPNTPRIYLCLPRIRRRFPHRRVRTRHAPHALPRALPALRHRRSISLPHTPFTSLAAARAVAVPQSNACRTHTADAATTHCLLRVRGFIFLYRARSPRHARTRRAPLRAGGCCLLFAPRCACADVAVSACLSLPALPVLRARTPHLPACRTPGFACTAAPRIMCHAACLIAARLSTFSSAYARLISP